MGETTLETLYSLRGRSTTRETVYGELRRRSEAVRSHPGLLLDQPYGTTPRERMDVFTQPGNAPVFVFVHGGYWRALEKEIFLALCAPLAARGYVAVNVEYGLRPDFSVPDIVAQVLKAIALIANNATLYGGRADQMILCGHSAGGHMVVWAGMADWQAQGVPEIDLKALIPVSGIFDLEPLRQTSINNDLALDADTARQLSPLHRPMHNPMHGPLPPTLCIVGENETRGFLEQTQNLNNALNAAGHCSQVLTADRHDHFSICQALADPETPEFSAVLAFMEAQITPDRAVDS